MCYAEAEEAAKDVIEEINARSEIIENGIRFRLNYHCCVSWLEISQKGSSFDESGGLLLSMT